MAYSYTHSQPGMTMLAQFGVSMDIGVWDALRIFIKCIFSRRETLDTKEKKTTENASSCKDSCNWPNKPSGNGLYETPIPTQGGVTATPRALFSAKLYSGLLIL